MDISVVIPTRNRARDLEECLLSLCKQSKKPLEVLIIDNDSSDFTKNIVNKFRRKLPIRYILEKKTGIAFARNRGIKEALGDIVAFTDDDCLVSPDWLRQIREAFKHFLKATAIQGRVRNAKPENPYSTALFFFEQRYWELKRNVLLKKGLLEDIESIGGANLAVKRKILVNKKIFFDERFEMGEDIGLGKKLLKKGEKIFFFPKILVWHKGTTSLTSFFKKRFNRGKAIFLRRHFRHTTESINQKIDFRITSVLIKEMTRKLSLFKKALFLMSLLFGWIAKNLGYFYASFYLRRSRYYIGAKKRHRTPTYVGEDVILKVLKTGESKEVYNKSER